MDPEKTNDPLEILDTWLEDAAARGVALPEAMTLATVDEMGRPSARIVLYKGRSRDGLAFFTNYESRKGRELARDPHATFVFHWAELQRQVRVDGTVEKLGAEESDAYFATRPRDSQIGAWASKQSEPLDSREALDAAFEAAKKRFEGKPVPRPPHWGGFRLLPERIEFWIGMSGRLHDRFAFTRSEQGWTWTRLAP